jgi:hypothetical protein
MPVRATAGSKRVSENEIIGHIGHSAEGDTIVNEIVRARTQFREKRHDASSYVRVRQGASETRSSRGRTTPGIASALGLERARRHGR